MSRAVISESAWERCWNRPATRCFNREGAEVNTTECQPDKLTEGDLVRGFDEVQRIVADMIRRYEDQYPDLARQAPSGNEVVREPFYRYDVHAVS